MFHFIKDFNKNNIYFYQRIENNTIVIREFNTVQPMIACIWGLNSIQTWKTYITELNTTNSHFPCNTNISINIPESFIVVSFP